MALKALDATDSGTTSDAVEAIDEVALSVCASDQKAATGMKDRAVDNERGAWLRKLDSLRYLSRPPMSPVATITGPSRECKR